MFYAIRNHTVFSQPQPPAGLRPIAALHGDLLPPVVFKLHESLRAWGDLGLSPGTITPERIWCNAKGALAFIFEHGAAPRPLSHVGMAQEVAAWLVLLDKWAAPFVVIAQARAVWSAQELAGALTFTSPPFSARRHWSTCRRTTGRGWRRRSPRLSGLARRPAARTRDNTGSRIPPLPPRDTRRPFADSITAVCAKLTICHLSMITSGATGATAAPTTRPAV
jgi:hypothetical protein